MDNIEVPTQPAESSPFFTTKRKALAGIMLWSVMNGIADLIIDHTGAAHLSVVVILIGAIGYGILILTWCKADSREHGEELGAGWNLYVLVFGVFALFAYLFKSRGLVRGFLGILYSLGFVVVMLIFDIIVVLIASMILGISLEPTPK